MPDSPPTPEQLRETLRRQRVENRLAAERLRGHHLRAAERRAGTRDRMESVSLDWVTPYAELLDRFRYTGDPVLTGPTSFWQRKQGKNWPIFQTEQELSLLRAPARLLRATNSYAQGLIEGLTSYVIGPGYTYRVAKKTDESEAPKELVAAVQLVVDECLRRNQWFGGEQPGLEEELFGRSVEDGEWGLRSFYREDGATDFRTVEPEQITAPPGDVLEDGEDGLFGVITPADDPQNVLAYWLQYGDGPDAGERVRPDEFTHFRRNVTRSMKRGLTDFCFDAYDAVYQAGVLRTNLGDAAAQQAAIVGVRQHAVGGKEDIEQFIDGQADYTRTEPLTGQTQRVRKSRRGSWEDVPEGLQYVAGPGAQNAPAHLQVLEGLLLSAGVKWNAPKWLVTGQANDVNYASSLTAESPFVRTVVRRQRGYREAFRRPVWGAVEHHVRTRGISAAGRSWSWEEVCRELDLLVEAPSPETRDGLQQAQQAQIEIPLGVDSRQQYAQRQGRDWDQVVSDNQEWDDQHGGAGGPLPLPGDPDADGLPGTTPKPDEPPPEPQPAGVTESLLESAGPHKFGCAMVPIDGPAAAALLALAARVADADLADDGRETQPHVTVRYGLHTDDAREVAALLADVPPVQMRLGAVTLFPGADAGKDFDVLKADVDGDDLPRLHARLGGLPHTDTHADYRPHATIAYVRAGLGTKYAVEFGRVDQAATAGRLVYGTAAGLKTTIPLRGVSGLVESVSEDTYQTLVGIGRWLLEDASVGLVAKQVTVHPAGGKAYQRTVMVRPDAAPAARPAAHASPAGGTDAHTPPAATSAPSGRVARAVDAVKRFGSAAMQTRVGKIVAGAEHKLAIVAHKVREVAAEAARRRKPPMSEDGVKRLTKVLAIADFIGGSLAGAAIGATVSPVAGKITSTSLPTASVLYVAYSGVRDPAGTWAAARQVVRDTLTGKAHHESVMESETLTPELADRLAAILDGPDADWREAVFLAAIAETGDADRAVEIAAAAGPAPAELPTASADDFGGEDDGGGERTESVSEETFAAMVESGAWLAEEIDDAGNTLLEAAGGLVPKRITVTTKAGKSYHRTVMVRPDAPGGGVKPAPKADPAAAAGRVKAALGGDPKKLTAGAVKQLSADLGALTVPQIKAIQAEYGVGGGRLKAERVEKLLAKAREMKKAAGPVGRKSSKSSAPLKVGPHTMPERYSTAEYGHHSVLTVAHGDAMRGENRQAYLSWVATQPDGSDGAKAIETLIVRKVGYRKPGESLADAVGRAFAREDYLNEPPRPGESPTDFAHRHFPALKDLGGLHVEGASGVGSRASLYDLHAMLPQAKALAAKGAAFHVSDKPVPVTDDMGHLAGQAPRGWAPGETWDDVAGCYDPQNKKVICGTGKGGTWSLAAHEAGHAIGHLYGLDDDAETVEWHKKLFPKLPEYLQQDGPGGFAGRQEMIAESIAAFVRGGKPAVEKLAGSEYARWLESHLTRIGSDANVGGTATGRTGPGAGSGVGSGRPGGGRGEDTIPAR